MKRLIAGVVVSASSILGVGAIAVPAAHACGGPCPPPPCEKKCPPPPPPLVCKPGWGGAGAVHPWGFGPPAPGGGVGDQNHCHYGPPGLGFFPPPV
jgi:hypothetical protein